MVTHTLLSNSLYSCTCAFVYILHCLRGRSLLQIIICLSSVLRSRETMCSKFEYYLYFFLYFLVLVLRVFIVLELMINVMMLIVVTFVLVCTFKDCGGLNWNFLVKCWIKSF